MNTQLNYVAIVLFVLFVAFHCGQCTNVEKFDPFNGSASNEIGENSTLIAAILAADKNNCTFSDANNRNLCEPKSRRKRYVAFPEGSSFSVAFCATVGFVGNPQYIYFSWAINWGLAYDLPNETWILNQRERKPLPKPLVQRRHRRELYERLEVAIDNMGYNGRACVLRALCESAQYFYRKGTNMIEELIRTVFSLPTTKVLPFEHNDLMLYDSAHRKGKSKMFCPSVYPDCSFSLIELALGEYSNPFNFM